MIARRYGRPPHEVISYKPSDFLLDLAAALAGERRDFEIEKARSGKQ